MSPTPDASSLVPTVDLSAPTATELTAVDAACRDHGFFLLVGHGAEQLIADMWRITEAFFAQDETVKGPVRRTVDNPFGYWDRELTKRKRITKRSSTTPTHQDRRATSIVGLQGTTSSERRSSSSTTRSRNSRPTRSA